MALAGLEPASCRHVHPPRVAAAPISLECRLVQTVPIGEEGPDDYLLLIAEVLAFHISDAVWHDGRVDVTALRPVARLGGSGYTHLGEVFSMQRPVVDR